MEAAWTETDRRFWWSGLAVLIIGIALRQWNLATAPFHQDEAIHAWYAYGFMTYNYDPIYHGPLLYHLLAVVYTIFGIVPYITGKIGNPELTRSALQLGANDFTARLVPSLLGIGLLAMVFWPARRWLGARGSLWCMVLLAISPVMVSYQRRLLHDALVMVLTLGAVLCLSTALAHPSRSPQGRRARIGLALLLTLFVATKANAFFVIAMLIAYWMLIKLQGWRRGRGDLIALPSWVPAASVPVFLFFLWLTVGDSVRTGLEAYMNSLSPSEREIRSSVVPAVKATLLLSTVMALWTTLQWRGLWRNRNGIAVSPTWLPAGLFLVVSVASFFALRDVPGREWMFTVICGLTIVTLLEWLRRLPDADERQAEYSGGQLSAASNDERGLGVWLLNYDWQTLLMAAAVSLFAFAFLYGHGFLWLRIPGEAIPDAGAGLATAKGRFQEVVSAMPRMLEYWGGQQKAPRLPGRHDYYLPLMLLYELPIVLAAIGGVIHASRRRTPFTDLLLWWAFTSFVVYAIANEKVPWLLTHIMLPLILLAGVWLGQLRFNTVAARNVFAAACGLGALFLLRGVSATNFERAADHHEPLFYAQTPDRYRDAIFNGLQRTRGSAGMVWVHPDKQWPAAWYFRDGAPILGNSHVGWGGDPPAEPLRMAVHLRDIDWQAKVTEGKATVPNLQKIKERLRTWKNEEVEYYVWTRASWPGLRPDRFWRFWWNRQVDVKKPLPAQPGELQENGIITGGETSIAYAVVSTPQ